MTTTAQNEAGAHLVQASAEQWAGIVAILGPAAAGARALVVLAPGQETIRSVGRFQYREGFEDVWLGDEHFNLRERKKARLCLKFLVEQRAFDEGSARHFLDEIDPYVRRQGDYLRSVDVKIDHYFNDLDGRLTRFRRDLIRAAGRNGRFYLRTN